jgi:hydroxymethylglutaryl-CoA lyase
MGDQIKIVEVGPRDGLQNETKVLSTEVKAEFIKKLVEAQLKSIEVTSFVKAEAIPQMGDAQGLYREVSTFRGSLDFPCLIPNVKGLELAEAVGVNSIALFSATSDRFSKKNVNATVDETFIKMAEVTTLAKQKKMRIRGYISTAFGCPYEGDIPLKRLEQVVERFFSLGIDELSIGDTTGVANPLQVKGALKVLLPKWDSKKIAMHFHDTRGMALSNILASLEAGIRIFDSSAGGLGGCPYAKGATGNVATEDVWYLCESMGISSGINFEKLVEASNFILRAIGKETPSKFLTAYQKTGKIK